MNSNAPFSEQFRIKGLEWADLDAAARLLEESKTAYLAQRKAALGDMTDAKAEKIVRSSQDWTDYIDKMVSAKKRANRARIELEFVKMRYWEHSGSDANKRAEMRL